MKTIHTIHTILIAALLAAGCSTIPTNSTRAKPLIQKAVLETIDRSENSGETARNIREINGLILESMAGNYAMTLEQVELKLYEEVTKIEMSVDRQLMAEELIIEIGSMIRQYIDDGKLNANERMELIVLLGWIDDAVMLFQGYRMTPQMIKIP
jgi:hypothetical protein